MTKRLPTKSRAEKGSARTPVRSCTFRMLLFLIAFSSFSWLQPAQAQISYQITGPTAGNLMRTSTDATTTGATKILAYNFGGGASTNNWSATQALPFAFNFYGTPVTHYMVNKNGLLSFDTTATGTVTAASLDVNTGLPNANLPNNTIAYFWGDFAAPLGSGDDIWSITYGTAPNREHWVFTYSFKLDALSYTYNAVVFEETTNKIYFVDMYNASASGTFTVGVQKDATTAVQLAGSPNVALLNTGAANSDNDYYTFDPFLQVPCSGAPTVGTVTASATNVCSGEAITLTLAGTSLDAGVAVQWQSSPDGITFTDIPGAIAGSLVITQTATTHYRAVATCNGTNPSNSNVVMVTSPALVSGTFTINAGASTGGTNFQTFADALNYISCGIGGPVVFNVVAGSGPYAEQIVMPEIFGTSVTNTITFNGNGNTISASPVSATRAVIKLEGVDYVTINNLNIETDAAATYGWGIHFQNGSDNNTISNNTITIGTTSTTESNSAGIVFSSSNTSVTTTGGDNGNNNVISGNTIIGGYKGIHLNGLPANPGNNQVINNTIKDFHVSGVEVNGVNGTLVEGNDFSRPTRPTVGTFYGVYLSGQNRNTVVSKNRIHNTHGGATSVTGAAYGIYSTANDAPAGSENIAKNNLIYNFNGTGTVNGIYNSGSDGIYYYNNTLVLDNMASTGIVRGFYQTTSASNIKLINNNIVVNSGGVATNQQAIYLNTPASTVESNRNNLYVPGGNTGYYDATQYLTLADWQMANSGIYDLNSVAADPFFTNVAAGDFTPTNSILNNAGQSLAVVTDDITGAPRHATTPDIGAYEFTPSTLDLGVTALVTPLSKNCYGSAEPVTVTVTNFGTSAVDFSTITANVTATVTGAATPSPISVVLTNAFNGGQPLAPTASMDVLVGTVNMTTAGTYTFNAVSNVTAGGTDGNTANNAMAATDVVVDPLVAGTAAAQNPTLCLSGTTTLNLTGQTGGDVQWQSGTSVTGPFTDIAGATGATFTLPTAITQTTYYQAVVSCGANNVASNVVTITVENPTPPTVAAVNRCGAGIVNLTATGGGKITWYDVATGGTALDTGATYSPSIAATTTFYASTTTGGGTANVGAPNNAIGAGGATGTTAYYQIFDVLSALTLDHVYVYPAAAGNVVLHLSDNSGTVLQVITVPVTTADVNQKTLIPINYPLAPGTGYRLGWYTGGVNLYRNTAGASYPYTIPGVISITGSSFVGYPQYWYYVYDFQITNGCESARTPVVATVNAVPATPTITQGGVGNRDLTSSAATGNQWLLNGSPIAGATSATYTATANGNYAVVVTDNGCSSDTSAIVNITNTGIKGDLAGMSVAVYPNPNNGQFSVKLIGYNHDAALELYSLTGQLIVKETAKAGKQITPMQVKNLAAGTYLLKVVSEKGVQISKLIVE